jgi:hypothetical protein
VDASKKTPASRGGAIPPAIWRPTDASLGVGATEHDSAETGWQRKSAVFGSASIPPLTTLGLFIGQALSPDGACQDAVARRLSERTAQGLAACSLNSGPYCKARKRLPLDLIRRLALTVGDRLERASPVDWKWRGRSIKLMDGTTISMPDTESNQLAYPQSGTQQAGLGFPLAMMVAVISLSSGAVLAWAQGPCRGKHTGEQALFRQLMPQLESGDIVLADRYHCNYFTAALLAAQGIDLVTRQHPRRITDFRRGRRLGRRDHLVDWIRPLRPSWMNAETYVRMPERLTMRETENRQSHSGHDTHRCQDGQRNGNRCPVWPTLAGRGGSALHQGRNGHGYPAYPNPSNDRQGNCRLSAGLQPDLCLDGPCGSGRWAESSRSEFQGNASSSYLAFEQQLRFAAASVSEP